MFGPPGSAYVYLSYGCHLCLNVVGRPGEAVLIRAIQPETGVEIMQERRGGSAALASGPGRVGQALEVSLADSGKLFGTNELRLEDGLSMIYGSNISWVSPTKPATKEIYPARTFDQLVGDAKGRQLDRSILDAVLAEAHSLQPKVSAVRIRLKKSSRSGGVQKSDL